MTYVVWCLVVVVVILAWHLELAKDDVQVLRKDVDDLREGERDLRSWRCSQLDSSDCLDFAKRRTESLARALGYEWKRTDAKEGWERSAVASVKPDAPKNSVPAGVAYGSPYFGCPPIRYFEAMDRRKADRRKPTPQAAPKSPPKKRRAH